MEYLSTRTSAAPSLPRFEAGGWLPLAILVLRGSVQPYVLTLIFGHYLAPRSAALRAHSLALPVIGYERRPALLANTLVRYNKLAGCFVYAFVLCPDS
jgi:hypothetical protein